MATASKLARTSVGSRREYYVVKFSSLVVKETDNIRYNYGEIEDLAASIKAIGCVDLLKGKKIQGENKWQVTDGFRRHKAMKLIFDETGKDMECKILPEDQRATPADRILDMFTVNSGKPLEP